MIVMQRVGSDFGGVLAYAMQPKKEPRIIGGSIGGQDQPLADIVRQFKATQLLRPSLKQCVHHAAIAFKSEENLPDHQLKVLAKEYLQRMGWDLEKSRWVLIRHNDTEHHHAHLIASRIQMNTKVVSDSLSWRRGMRICRQLEEEYGLEPVSSEPRRERRMSATEQQMLSRLEERSTQMQASEEHSSDVAPQSQSLSKPVFKTIEEVQKAVREASTIRQSLNEFMSALAQQGIDVRARLDAQGKVAGLSYQLDGRNFRASNLGANFTWQHLQQIGVYYDKQRSKQRDASHLKQWVQQQHEPQPELWTEDREASRRLAELSGDREHPALPAAVALGTDFIADYEVSNDRREFEESITIPTRTIDASVTTPERTNEYTNPISPRTVEVTAIEFGRAAADLLPSNGTQTRSDGFFLLPGNRKIDEGSELSLSISRDEESALSRQIRLEGGDERLGRNATTSREFSRSNPEYRSELTDYNSEHRSGLQQHNAEPERSDSEDARTQRFDDQGDHNPCLPTQTDAEVFVTSGDWPDRGNVDDSGDDVLLSTHQDQRSSGALALENLWTRNNDPREIGAIHESRGTQVSPEISSTNERQIEELPIGLDRQGMIDEGRTSETVGELNTPLPLPLGKEALHQKEGTEEPEQKPLSKVHSEQQGAEQLQQPEEEEEVWEPLNVGVKDLLKVLQASGIEDWKVSIHDPTNPDFPMQNYVMDGDSIGSQQAQFLNLQANLGLKIAISPDSENHGLIIIDHLRLNQVAKMQEDLPLAAIIRTGSDRCQVWLRHSQPMSEEERLTLQGEYIERFGGRAGQLRLVGVDQKVELLIADPDAVIEVEDRDRLRGRGSVIEVPIPPHPEPTAELATVTQWVAAEELSQVFSPSPSELEMSWDAKRDQLRFHNGPWVSDEIDNQDLIDFCLLVEQAKEDWQLQQIWEQEQQQKSGWDFER